jgi:tetratricopeptide (TPR) repeat protein
LEAIKNERPPDTNPQLPAKQPAKKDAARIADTSRRDSVRPPIIPDEPLAGGDPYAQGNALLKRGEYAKAVPYFSQAIAIKPEYRAYFGRAGAYQNLQRMELAIEDYTQAIRLNPASAMAYHDRAVCLARLKENDRALADYNRALELASDNPLTWNGRGVIYLRRKEYQKAIPDFTRAIQLRPTFAQSYENRAAAERALGDVARANADLDRATGLKQ